MNQRRILRQLHRARAIALLSCLLLAIAPRASAKNWSTEAWVDPGIAPTDTRFAVQNKQYKLIEQKNRNGKVIRQTLIGEGFVQSTIDRDGDGYLDSWELRRPNTVINMSSPSKGRFTRMDVQKLYPQGILRMEFFRNSKGSFQLISSNAEPYKKLRKADDGDQYLSAGCRIGDVLMQKTAFSTLAALVKPDSNNDLREALAGEAMNKECNQGEFAKNRSKIIDGIMSVVKSDSKESIGIPADKKPKTKGTFLQCLRFYDLDIHANRITGAFSNYISTVPNNNFKWKISCDAASGDAGRFEQKPAPILPIIVLGLAVHQGAPGGDLKSAYAATFFHEMLHYSLIDDEATTSSIEKCCSQLGGESGVSCKQVEYAVRIQKRARVFETVFAKQFGDKYASYMDTLRKQFGKKVNIDKEMNRFFTEAAKRYEKIKAECGVADNTPLVGECNARFSAELKDVINKEFGDNGNGRCERAAADQSTAKAYCETIKQIAFTKFRIDLEGLDGKNYCLNRKTSLLGWLVSNVYAEGDESLDTVCGIKETPTKNDPLELNENNAAPPNLGLITPVEDTPSLPDKPPQGARATLFPSPQKDDAIVHAGADATIDTKGPTTNFGRPTPNADQGPSGVAYSSSPTERETQVLNYLQHQEQSESRITQIADRLAQQAFPNAEAEASEQKQSSQKTSSSPQKDGQNLSGYDQPSSASRQNALGSEPLARFPSVADPLPPSRSIASVDSSYVPVKASAASSVGAAAGAKASGPGSASPDPSLPQYKPVYQYRYGSGHKFFPVAGLGGPASSSPDGAEKKPVSQSKLEAEVQEKKSLIVFLQGPYDTVRPELDNQRFVDELAHCGIQVIDDAGKAYGSGVPSAKLTYDERVRHLVIVSSRALKANQ